MDSKILLSDQKIRILHVVSRLPVGGVENMIFKVIKGYDKKRFDVRVCCLQAGGEIADELVKAGYTIEVLERMRGHGFDFGAVRDIYSLLKRWKIHILRTHQYHANLYGRIAGILAGVPIKISSFHNLYASPYRPKVHRRIFNYVLGAFTDALVAVSHAVARDIQEYDWIPAEKIRVIYNGISMEASYPMLSKEDARRMFALPPRTLIVGSVGRLTEQKGHRYLIEAMSKVRNGFLAIAGEGPLLAELKALTENLGIDCTFTGRLDPGKIPAFLKAIDVFCFPSLWEGFGTALTEAMAEGLPSIASDLDPLREVLDDTGILVPPRDANALAESLRRLMEDQSLRNELGSRSKNRAMQFSIENVVRSYENLFDEILMRKGMI